MEVCSKFFFLNFFRKNSLRSLHRARGRAEPHALGAVREGRKLELVGWFVAPAS